MKTSELVYIDWNLFSILKEPKLEPHKMLSDFLTKHKNDVRLVYSDAHLDDLSNAIVRNERFISNDLKYLSGKTNDLALVQYFDRGYVNIEYRNTTEFYQTNILDNATPILEGTQLIVNQMTAKFKPIRDEVIRKHFGTNPKSICNFSLSQIDELIKEMGIAKSLKEFTEFGLKLRGDTAMNPISHIDYFMTAYMNLDLIGFYPDSLSGNQTFNNLLNDSKHSAYGSICKGFITNDNKCYHKSKFLYEYYESDSTLIRTCKLKNNDLEEFESNLQNLIA